jgi:thiol-disulfide isomerase/thioredoxin
MRFIFPICLTASLVFGATQTKKQTSPASPAKPAAAAVTHTLSEFKLGRTVMGTGTLADAKGKGVVLDFWGVNCPPCIRSLPDIQALSVKYKDKVNFYGVESQGSDKAQIEPIIKKAGVTYPITTGYTKMPLNFTGIPHVAVFDSNGKMTFEGSPFDPEFEKAVEAASVPAKK